MVTETKVKPFREIEGGKLRLNFHIGQSRCWDSKARFPGMISGTQVGKTCFAPHWQEREIRLTGPGDHLAITATFPLLNLKMLPEYRYVFETLYRVADYKDVHGSRYLLFKREKHNEDDVVLFNDKDYEEAGVQETRIIFGSATNSESIESATAKSAVLDECGQKQFRRDSWEATLRRLSLARGRCLLLTTLYSYGWLKDEVHDEWVKGNPDFDLIQVDSIVNPAFPLKEYEDAKKRLPGWKFELFYRGRYAKPAGMIYDCFDSANSIVDPFDIPSDWPVYVGNDFGPTNMAGLWLAQDKSTGYLYIAKEYLASSGMATFEHVENFKEMSEGLSLIKRVGGAHHEKGWRGDFTQAGWRVDEPTEREVEAGIQQVYGLIKTGKLFVFRNLVNFLDEINSYSYELDEKYRPTGKIENKSRYHLMDCLRAVAGDFNPVDVKKSKGPKAKSYL